MCGRRSLSVRKGYFRPPVGHLLPGYPIQRGKLRGLPKKADSRQVHQLRTPQSTNLAHLALYPYSRLIPTHPSNATPQKKPASQSRGPTVNGPVWGKNSPYRLRKLPDLWLTPHLPVPTFTSIEKLILSARRLGKGSQKPSVRLSGARLERLHRRR